MTDIELYKKWFRNHKDAFEKVHLYELWEKYNEESVIAFRNEFKFAFNSIAKRLSLPQIID